MYQIGEDQARSWAAGQASVSSVANTDGGRTWSLKRDAGNSPYDSSDADTGRIWWKDTGVHQNATFCVQPDPVSGMIVVDSLIAGRADLLLESLWYLSLPVLTLSFVLTGPIIKMVRENVSQSMSLGFIQYGEAVGLSKKMLASDSLLAAVAPTLTLIGILFSFMLGGAVLIESMFSINGLGQFSLQSVLAMDYPAIQGVVIVISSLTLLVYLLLDVAQALLDPRLRA